MRVGIVNGQKKERTEFMAAGPPMAGSEAGQISQSGQGNRASSFARVPEEIGE